MSMSRSVGIVGIMERKEGWLKDILPFYSKTHSNSCQDYIRISRAIGRQNLGMSITGSLVKSL
jgi:hypothetical protein